MTTPPKASMIKGFDTVTLQVASVERALLFYRDALGIEFSRRSDRAADALVGGVRLLLHEDFDPSLKTERRGAGVGLHLSVLDVDACFEALRERGVVAEEEPENHPWGREFTVRDPDGYEIEFIGPVV